MTSIFRVDHSNNYFACGYRQIKGIEWFWSVVKTRNSLFWKIKNEYEFHFIKRHESLYYIFLIFQRESLVLVMLYFLLLILNHQQWIWSTVRMNTGEQNMCRKVMLMLEVKI